MMTLLRAASAIVATAFLNSGTAGPSLPAILAVVLRFWQCESVLRRGHCDRRPAALLLRSVWPPGKGPETHRLQGLVWET